MLKTIIPIATIKNWSSPGLLFAIIVIIIAGCVPKTKNDEKRQQILSTGEDTLNVEIRNQLQEMRSRSKKEKWGFIPVYTDLFNSDLKERTGAVLPLNFDEHIRLQNLKAERLLESLTLEKENHESSDALSFDWRRHNGGTHVKNQGRCGSCWVFGAHAALEGSWRIKYSQEICSSEQNSLDWNGKSTCSGGWPSDACDYLMSKGSATCLDYPYAIGKANRKSAAQPYSLRAWGYVGKKSGVPSIGAIKKALIKHGPLIAGVYVSREWNVYGESPGIYDVSHGNEINHIIAIIGWDDAKGAWLIKNSWGTNWGSTCGYGSERGYMWIKYNCSKVGFGAIWVIPERKGPQYDIKLKPFELDSANTSLETDKLD